MVDNKLLIGSEEWCGIPELNIPLIKCRVDSGAKTSSIHAFNIQAMRKNGEQWVSFEVHPVQDNRKVVVRCEAPVVDRRSIKSSSGISEKRFVIKSILVIGDHTYDVELTLTNRDSMGYRMLLGREAMMGRMIVDPAKRFCLGGKDEDQVRKIYESSIVKQEGLRIGLLASDPDLYSNRRVIEAGEERGHEMVFMNIRHCYMRLDAINPEVHYRGGTIFENFDAVIPRIRPSMTFYGCALTRQFEAMGVYCLNTASAIAQARDKLRSLQLLLGSGVDIPVTGFANSPLDTADLINMVGGAPLVLKLLEGAQGRGVVLAETKKAAESVINAFKSLHADILVQEFIKEASGKDLRCFVIDGRVVTSIERTASPGEFRANIHQGGSAQVVKLTPDEKKIALKASKTLGLVVAGVDIIRSERGPLLLEVNSSPGLNGVETASGKDVASVMISTIEKKVGWQRNIPTISLDAKEI